MFIAVVVFVFVYFFSTTPKIMAAAFQIADTIMKPHTVSIGTASTPPTIHGMTTKNIATPMNSAQFLCAIFLYDITLSACSSARHP